MPSPKPRFPASTSGHELSWLEAKISGYPINLFTGYGIRRNTLDDMTHWRRGAAAAMPEALCQLGLAYLDGNGIARDLATAKKWLKAGAGQGHLFCRYKLAELEFHSLAGTNDRLTQKCLPAVSEIYGCASSGIGEACVALHFILKKHAKSLGDIGWDPKNAMILSETFMSTLRLAYEDRNGSHRDRLIRPLLQLGALGSGRAYYCLGKMHEDSGDKVAALDYFTRGTKECKHADCLTKALRLANRPQADALISWAGKQMPVAAYHWALCMKSLEGADPSFMRHGLKAVKLHLREENFTAALEVANFLIDLNIFNMRVYLDDAVELFGELRQLAPWLDLPEQSDVLLGKTLSDYQKSVDGYSIGLGQGPLTNSRVPFGLKGGIPFKTFGLSLKNICDAEFTLIIEHGILLRGVARGSPESLDYAGRWTWNQMSSTTRIRSLSNHDLIKVAYDYASGYQTLSHKQSVMMPALEQCVPPAERNRRDRDNRPEFARIDKSVHRELFFRRFGRQGLPSHRLMTDIRLGQKDKGAQYQPWHPGLTESPADKIALLWETKLRSKPPIDPKWSLAGPDAEEDSPDAKPIASLTRSGDYGDAREHFCKKMKVTISNMGQGFKFEVKRMLEMDEHELLSIMAREMIARGDYASAEPIVDYLIYARLWTKPWGRLHHLSAWVKYHQGHLSDAIRMMEDCTQAIASEELHADDLDLDLREFKLFYVELLLRAERLKEAETYLHKLATACRSAKISDPRVEELKRVISSLETVDSDKLFKSMSRVYYDRDVSVEPKLMMSSADDLLPDELSPTPKYLWLPLSNMDRYRCVLASPRRT